MIPPLQKYILTLTLDGNGGSVNTSYDSTIEYGNTITLPDESKMYKYSYEFIGWGYQHNNTTVTFEPGETVSAQTINPNLKDNDQSSILYAKWRKSITYSL